MTQITKIIPILGLSLLMAGCAQRVGDLTLVSTRDIDLSGHTKLNVNQSQRYMGEDCTFYLFGRYPFGPHPSLHTAVERALLAGKGNIIVNEVTGISEVWAIIGTVECIDVRGNVMSVPYKPLP